MDIPTHSELVDRINAFLDRHQMAPTRLGRLATGEPNLVPAIRDGRQPNLDTLNRLGKLMAEHDATLRAELGDLSGGKEADATPPVAAVIAAEAEAA